MKDMIDFSKMIHLTKLNGKLWKIVATYKYLGTMLDYCLSWEEDTSPIYSKSQMRLFYRS